MAVGVPQCNLDGSKRSTVMQNGVYAVRFAGELGIAGSGVCYVEDGRIRGGDSGFAYIGTYKEAEGRVSATLRVVQHTPGVDSVFGGQGGEGWQSVEVKLLGRSENAGFSLVGSPAHMPKFRLEVAASLLLNLQ
jgi:hypothetical protein